MVDLKTFEVMPVDVYVGGCGHVVLCQEWTEATAEPSYSRIMLHERDAEKVCQAIMAAANRVRGK